VVRIRVLGPVELDMGGRPADIGGPRQRAVLALLLVGRGGVVSVDRMIDQLWRGEPPPRAIASLQAYVSNLRRLLEPDRPQRAPATLLVSRAPGYALRLPADAVDAWRFEELLRGARRTDPAAGLRVIDEALSLWQGPAYAEVADEEWAAPEAARLTELRQVARELSVELTVRVGRASDAVPAAEVLTREFPLREEGWRLLALAQWASGRQADALGALRRARRHLADELGLDPGPALADLESAILTRRTEVLDAAVDAAPPADPAERAGATGAGGTPDATGTGELGRVPGVPGAVGASGTAGGAATAWPEDLADRTDATAANAPGASSGTATTGSGAAGGVAGTTELAGATATGVAQAAGGTNRAGEAAAGAVDVGAWPIGVPGSVVVPNRTADVLFVGREAELARLTALAARAARAGGLGLVTGEAGAGKSSLLARALADLTAGGWTVVVGRCPEFDGAPAGWAWVEALGQLARRTPPDPQDAAAVAPLLSAAQPHAAADAMAGRFRLHRAVTGWLRAAATAGGPLAIVLDDLHRADGETLALLESVARDLDGVPVLLLGAYRPSDGGDRLEEALAVLARRSPERIALPGLGLDEIDLVLTSVHGGPLDRHTVAALAERTGGNPFYVRESARLLSSEGALVALAEVPEGVRDVLRRRLARLPAPAVAVLRLAAVVGREAEVDVLVAAADVDENAVYDALETGVVAGLLGEPAPGRVRFAHALVRDTLYADLTHLRRTRMHGRVAEVVRRLRADDFTALAYHYGSAASAETAPLAVDYGVRAAELAEGRYAHDRAVTLLEQALAAVDRLPHGDDSRADVRADVFGRLMRAQVRSGNVPAARATRGRALDAARAAGRDDLVIAAFTAWTEPTPWLVRQYGVVDGPAVDAVQDLLDRADLTPEARCRMLDVLVSELVGEDQARVDAAAEEALAIARDVGDPDLLAFGLTTVLKGTHIDLRSERRATLTAELDALVRDRELPAFQWYAAHAHGTVAAARNDVAGLRRHVADGIAVARRYRMVEAEAVHRCTEAMLAHVDGRFGESERLYAEATGLLQRAGSAHAEGFLAVAVATLRLSEGRLAEFEPTLREVAAGYPDGADAWSLALAEQGRLDEARAARSAVPPLREDFFRTVFATLRTKALVALDLPDEAPGLIALLTPLHDQLGGVLSSSLAVQPVAHTLGELHRLVGDHERAAASFAEAERVARRWASPHWAAAARAELAAV
jgi:DNA-binding SARP family transcriptional activator